MITASGVLGLAFLALVAAAGVLRYPPSGAKRPPIQPWALTAVLGITIGTRVLAPSSADWSGANWSPAGLTTRFLFHLPNDLLLAYCLIAFALPLAQAVRPPRRWYAHAVASYAFLQVQVGATWVVDGTWLSAVAFLLAAVTKILLYLGARSLVVDEALFPYLHAASHHPFGPPSDDSVQPELGAFIRTGLGRAD